MRHVRDPAELLSLLQTNAREGWTPPIDDIATWLRDPANFALRRGDDVVLFEVAETWPGPLKAHVFCASRGREALETGRRALEQAFAYGATEILGETPARFRDAWAYARLLGFRPYGEEETDGGRVIRSRLLPSESGSGMSAHMGHGLRSSSSSRTR